MSPWNAGLIHSYVMSIKSWPSKQLRYWRCQFILQLDRMHTTHTTCMYLWHVSYPMMTNGNNVLKNPPLHYVNAHFWEVKYWINVKFSLIVHECILQSCTYWYCLIIWRTLFSAIWSWVCPVLAYHTIDVIVKRGHVILYLSMPWSEILYCTCVIFESGMSVRVKHACIEVRHDTCVIFELGLSVTGLSMHWSEIRHRTCVIFVLGFSVRV